MSKTFIKETWRAASGPYFTEKIIHYCHSIFVYILASFLSYNGHVPVAAFFGPFAVYSG